MIGYLKLSNKSIYILDVNYQISALTRYNKDIISAKVTTICNMLFYFVSVVIMLYSILYFSNLSYKNYYVRKNMPASSSQMSSWFKKLKKI